MRRADLNTNSLTAPDMQVPVSGAIVAQTSSLLAIPGEIRNRIYELAVEDANAWQDEDFAHITDDYQRQNALLDQRRRNVPLLRKTSSASQDWCSPKRPYLGLTQVCRQLRAEFLGLHSKIRIGVALEATTDYLNDVVAMQTNNPESAVGCIDVRISFVWELKVDVLPMILASSKAPNLDLSFTCYDHEAGPQLWPNGIDSALKPPLI